jgi:hypothetical protein
VQVQEQVLEVEAEQVVLGEQVVHGEQVAALEVEVAA